MAERRGQRGEATKIPGDLPRLTEAATEQGLATHNSLPFQQSSRLFLHCHHVQYGEGKRNAEYIPTIKHEGKCTEVIHETVDCSKYPQTRGQVLCKPRPPEVCGTDGVTYKNECVLCNQILKTKSEIGIQNIGPCPKRKL
ncbi:serine protease inhibitor Kazal-type 5 [Crotalus adamanteus]|uniref:Serine protease inhibitor Kazal-type 5 n=1 Tax=Crotalus adamanteus TaxID=8729 RepID=A0AAW1BX68_CROAD